MTSQFPGATPASTVILVREVQDDFEVYLLKRSASSGFMPGKYVFPGGMVDKTDRDLKHWLPYVDMELPAIEEYLADGSGCPRSIGVCGCRHSRNIRGSRRLAGAGGKNRRRIPRHVRAGIEFRRISRRDGSEVLSGKGTGNWNLPDFTAGRTGSRPER